jgi:Asp-tRNA(Asn)/Glu-tRNA(Gln) amidotransferase A subunit family amidase
MGKVDILINANDIVHTNLTGHPSIAIPVGFRQRDGMPMPYSSILTGRLNRETDLLALAKAYQDQLDTHRKRPPLESLLQKKKEDALNGSEKKNN